MNKLDKYTSLSCGRTINNCIHDLSLLIGQTVELEFISGRKFRAKIIDYTNSSKERLAILAVQDITTECIKFLIINNIESINLIEESLKVFK